MILKFIVSFGGLGFLPFVPGTWGTIGAIPLYFLLSIWGVNLLNFTLIFTLVSIPLSHLAAKAAEDEDPSFVVIDEVSGMLVTLLWIKTEYIFTVVFLGFVLFRLFDIIKPTPAYESQKIPYGIGIMVDDIIAGIYANIVLHTLLAWGIIEKLHQLFPKLVK
jgi:phosphatidylglycerophosphatase A